MTAETTTITVQTERGPEQRTYSATGVRVPMQGPAERLEQGYIVGLDLGRMADYTAVVVVERTKRPGQEAQYAVRNILRVRQKPYTDVARAVRELLATPDLRGAALVIDQTGVGVAIADMLRALGLEFIPITITGGDTAAWASGGWHVPKRDLVSALEVLLQQGRLKISGRDPSARVLTEELESFQVKVSAAGHDTYGAWREGAHDDLVLAAALAVWYAEHGRSEVAYF